MGKRNRNGKKNELPWVLVREPYEVLRKMAEGPIAFRNLGETLKFLPALAFAREKAGAKSAREAMINQLVEQARKNFVALPLEKAQDFLAMSYLHQISVMTKGGSTFDVASLLGGAQLNDFAHTKNLFNKILEMVEKNGHPEDEVDFRHKAYTLSFLAGIIALTGKNHAWSNLVTGARMDDEMRLMLQCIIYVFLQFGGSDIEVIPNRLWNSRGARGVGLFQKALTEINFDGPIMRMPAPEEDQIYFRALKNGVLREIQESQKDLIELAIGFYERIPEHSNRFAEMWREMRGPGIKYEVLNSDCIEIALPALAKVGYKSLSFSGENMNFPEVKATLVRQHFGRTFRIVIPLKQKPLETYRQKNPTEEPILEYIDLLLAYISTHCLWAIVTGKIFKKSTGKKTGANQRGSYVLQSRERRAKYRNLPHGHHPSSRAIELSRDKFNGGTPPPGMTFVSKHNWPKEDKIVQPMPTQNTNRWLFRLSEDLISLS
jgi:hypothetical protein